ncbi:MAG: hypothetical protein SGCHY_003141 [Lobulomycetales sp.]
MATATTNVQSCSGGFDFGNYARNKQLEGSGAVHPPGATKTGTTIVGCVYRGGIVLGADTRATNGSIVADKNCEKIHYLAPNMYCCGAGTAADTEFTTNLISSKLELHRLATGRQARVVSAMTMLKQMLFRHQGQIGAALVLGGIDVTGPHLYTIAPHGSTDKLPYVTMGSGSLAAMAVFESKWKKDMTREEAIEIVKDAIESGIFNDLGSGSNVDVVVLTEAGAEVLRNYKRPNERGVKEKSYKFKKGTTAVLKTSVRELVKVSTSTEQVVAMDTSSCKKIQRVSEAHTFFDILESPVTFDVNVPALKAAFLRIQQRAHPDAVAQKPLQERVISGEISSFANKAFATLKSPLERAVYLLKLAKVDISEDSLSNCPDQMMVLATVMEARQDIADADTLERLDQIKQENDERIQESTRALSAAFRKNDYATAREETAKLRYWTRIDEAIVEKR